MASSSSMGSKFKLRVLPEPTAMEYFPTDLQDLASLLVTDGINPLNPTGQVPLTAFCQTQTRFGRYQESKPFNLCENVVPFHLGEDSSLFSNAKYNSPTANGGKKIHYSNVAENRPIYSRQQPVIDQLRVLTLNEEPFSGIALDPEVTEDPELIHAIDQSQLVMTDNNLELIGEVLKQNVHNSQLPEGMNVSNFISSGNPSPIQVNHCESQLDISHNFIVVDDAVTIVNHPEYQNARVLAVIPGQSEDLIFHESPQFVGCQQIPTVVEVVNMDNIQQIMQINAAETTVAKRKPGRPRKDSYQTLSKKMEYQLASAEPVVSVSGERRSKLKGKRNIKNMVNEINTDDAEEEAYAPVAAGRKRKLSTSSTASTSSASSSEENQNPNSSKKQTNNMASKKSRDKKKELERQTEEELVELGIVNDQLKRKLERFEWALKQVQAVLFKE